MKTITPLTSFEQLKLLADSRRMEIVRLLMAESATLSQLGRALGKHPAWVQHHIKALEAGGLVEIGEVRVTDGITEKYYRAKAGGFLVQEMILPQGVKPVLVLSGSHDLAVERLALQISHYVEILAHPVGSLDGLVNLRMGLCNASGAHLLDTSGEYNTPFVSRLFPDRLIHLVTLAHRTQGWMVAPGNPKGIRSAADLLQPGLRFVNRNPGSGTRLWLDAELQRLGILPGAISGYDQVVKTHTEAALAIQSGQADAALGLEAAAIQHGLDFLPLFAERYDLVLPDEQLKPFAPLLDMLQNGSFRQGVRNLRGYDTSHTGEEVDLR
ncbi:MAG: substrate-binding domain-containing protein [Anaerolineales bacterium]